MTGFLGLCSGATNYKTFHLVRIWCVPRNKNFQRRNVVHIFWIFVIWQLAFECFNGALMPSLNSVWDLNIYEAKCPNFSCFWWLFWRMLKSPLYKLQRFVSLFMESMKGKWFFCNLWFLYKQYPFFCKQLGLELFI